MFRSLLIVCAALMVGNAIAQDNSSVALPDELRQALPTAFHRSLSGQFVIYREPGRGWLPVERPSNDIALVRLDPPLLAISCERIKRAFLNEVGGADQWRGHIFLALHPFQSLDDAIVVTSTKYDDGWNYRLDVPDRMESPRLILAVVNVLLLEMANRDAKDRSAEIPVWLSRGLSQQIMRSSDMELVIKPPSQSQFGVSVGRAGTWDGDRTNTLGQAHEELSSFPPLTIEQLSWFTDDQYAGIAGQGARGSAQLFFYELTHLEDGRDCMRSFITELPHYLNWQFALLKAFSGHFDSQLELEKWWTLHVVSFTGRNLAQTWSSDESWAKLEELIRPAVEVRSAPDELPTRTAMSVQAIIREADFVTESRMISTMVQQLYVLRFHVSQDVIPLVDGYRQTLQNYLTEGSKAGTSSAIKGQMIPSLDRITRETIRELDGLDARREKLQPKQKPASQAKNDPSSIVVSH